MLVILFLSIAPLRVDLISKMKRIAIPTDTRTNLIIFAISLGHLEHLKVPDLE